MSSPLQSFTQVVSDLNEASYDLGVFNKYWASLPAGVRTAIKAATVVIIDTAIADLASVKEEIQAL